MRESGPAAGDLPLQRSSKRGRVHCHQKERVLSREVLPHRVPDLIWGRKMQESVAFVVRRTAEDPGRFGFGPLLLAGDLVDRGGYGYQSPLAK